MNIFVNSGEARIAAEVAGSGDNTIVLLHGFPLSRAIWSEQMRALSAAARVVAIDLRGMGESSDRGTLARRLRRARVCADVRRAT